MTGILLVHGAWHGTWCWDDFAARLSDIGHDVRTVRLRGHDPAPGRIRHRIHHYLDDVRRAAAQFPVPPVLVGHSMGGLLAQKHLDARVVRGAVLMASIPPSGAGRAAVRLGVRHPVAMLKAILQLRLRPLVATAALVRELFFTPDTTEEVVNDCHARVQDESFLAFVDMLVFVRAHPARAGVPVLVLGAERDGIISVEEVHRTARVYGTQAEIFPGMGHNMMLEAGWPRVVDRVDAWVRRTAS